MDGEHPLPVAEPELVDGSDDLDAGVGNEDVDSAEAARDFVHACVDLSLVSHVHRKRERLLAAGVELFRSGSRRVKIDVGNGDLRALL